MSNQDAELTFEKVVAKLKHDGIWVSGNKRSRVWPAIVIIKDSSASARHILRDIEESDVDFLTPADIEKLLLGFAQHRFSSELTHAATLNFRAVANSVKRIKGQE